MLSYWCLNKNVVLLFNNCYDRHRRMIAEVFFQGKNLNKELVKQGYAWHYNSYSKDKYYAALQKEAQKNKRGLWIDKKPIKPWEFRKKNKNDTNNKFTKSYN